MTQDDLIKQLEGNPMSIKDIENPSIELQRIAVKQNESLIEYIKDPDLEIQLIAISSDIHNVSKIANPHYYIQKLLISLDHDYWHQLSYICEELQLFLIYQSHTNVRYIPNPTHKAMLEAIKTDFEFMGYFDNANLYNKQLQIDAINIYPESIVYMTYPCLDAQLLLLTKEDFQKHVEWYVENIIDNENLNPIFLHKLIQYCRKDEDSATHLVSMVKKNKNYVNSAQLVKNMLEFP